MVLLSQCFLRLYDLIRRQVRHSLLSRDYSWPGRCSPHRRSLYAEAFGCRRICWPSRFCCRSGASRKGRGLHTPDLTFLGRHQRVIRRNDCRFFNFDLRRLQGNALDNIDRRIAHEGFS